MTVARKRLTGREHDRQKVVTELLQRYRKGMDKKLKDKHTDALMEKAQVIISTTTKKRTR